MQPSIDMSHFKLVKKGCEEMTLECQSPQQQLTKFNFIFHYSRHSLGSFTHNSNYLYFLMTFKF